MFRKAMLYGLPIYLYLLELLLKHFAAITADSVVGPTLAGAGLGFLLPLTELKEVSSVDPKVLRKLKEAKAVAYSRRDKSFSDFVWVCFFCALGFWMWCIYLTLPVAQGPGWNAFGWHINESFAIGCIMFFVSIVLTEIKERL